MNENYSAPELIYKKRWMAQEIAAAIDKFPVVVLTGARQVGKSTLLQNEFPDFKYINFDDHKILQQAKHDPQVLWKGAEKIIIDEVQRVPEVFSAIKLAVDSSQRRLRFLISGSANLLLMEKVSETLAGRSVYFELLPMSYGEMTEKENAFKNFQNLWNDDFEIKEQKIEAVDPLPLILRGFMPPLLTLENTKQISLWWEGYVRTYLERDLRQLSQVDSLIDFRKVVESFALRTGCMMKQTDVAKDAGVSQPTVFRYLKLMEVSNIVSRVPAFYVSRISQIKKTPKLYFVDPALSVYLSGYFNEDALRKARELGNYFETMVFLHLRILTELMTPKGKMYFWQTTGNKEVDFVIEDGRKLLAFEVKMTDNPGYNDYKNLLLFCKEYPRTVMGILLYTGSEIQWLHSQVIAVPWNWLA